MPDYRVTIALNYEALTDYDELEETVYADLIEFMRGDKLKFWATIQETREL
jgi:hypothetical protein